MRETDLVLQKPCTCSFLFFLKHNAKGIFEIHVRYMYMLLGCLSNSLCLVTNNVECVILYITFYGPLDLPTYVRFYHILLPEHTCNIEQCNFP